VRRPRGAGAMALRLVAADRRVDLAKPPGRRRSPGVDPAVGGRRVTCARGSGRVGGASMTAMTPDQLTEQVLAAYAGTPDPRLRELFTALISHLHAFATETRLTPEEWTAGIEFLTATGQKCDEQRQEFILLSDVLGLSSLVDVVHSAHGATESTVLGPFYLPGAP